MELLHNLALGFGSALTVTNLFYCFIGTLIGTLIGVLPGIGPLATIAMLLPITFGMEPTTALIMLAGVYYGAMYGGSTTAILVNLPGESAAVVTCLDGYQMARQGNAGKALAGSALGSFFAGCVATIVIAGFAPVLAELAFDFTSVEYFSLIIFGLVAAIILSRGSLVLGIGMVIVGLLLGTVGSDLITGTRRFTLGFSSLAEGIDFVPLAMGLFGVSEVLINLERTAEREVLPAKISRLLPTLKDLKIGSGPAVRGTILGCILGVLPGGGAILSSFASYTLEKRLSRHPERFGNGALEGVVGPEAANNAGAQTSFIPLLTLGIPGNAVIAVFLGAMILHGIQPGPQFITKYPDLFWAVVVSMWIGNLMLVVLNLPLISLWVKLLAVPYRLLFPAILLFASIGAYSVNHSTFDVLLIPFFGVIGYFFAKVDCDPAPLLLGFILGPMMEENLRRSMVISKGDWTVFFSRPLSLTFLVLSVLLIITVVTPAIRTKRGDVFAE